MTVDIIDPAQAVDAMFTGRSCQLVDQAGVPRPMALLRWTGAVGATDRSLLLERCRGRTIDVGCGPGRLVAGLTALGVPALGIDISPEAVRQARSRGALAIRRDVFAPLPGEGRWDCALLADGNIGIGGDPDRLLARIRRLVRPDGRVVVELGAEGADVVRHRWRLRVEGRVTPVFDWAVVGLDAIERVADAAGFIVDDTATIGGHPERLLERVRRIVRPGGRVVVELDADGTDVVRHRWRLRVGGRVTPVFDWAVVGLDAIERVADAAGFVVDDVPTIDGRHAAALRQAACA